MNTHILGKKLMPFALILLTVVIWQYSEDQINATRKISNLTSLEFFIPTPLAIYSSFTENWSQILTGVFQTTSKALSGFFLGSLLAISLATIYDMVPILRSTTIPFLFALQSFPIVGLAPAIVLAFGQDNIGSIVLISIILTYFPVLLTLDGAFQNTPNAYIELGIIYGANKWQLIKYYKLPLAIPSLITAMKLAAPASIIGATMGEWLGSSDGIGRLIIISLYQMKPSILYGCLIVLAIVSACTVSSINLLGKILFPWTQINKE